MFYFQETFAKWLTYIIQRTIMKKKFAKTNMLENMLPLQRKLTAIAVIRNMLKGKGFSLGKRIHAQKYLSLSSGTTVIGKN